MQSNSGQLQHVSCIRVTPLSFSESKAWWLLEGNMKKNILQIIHVDINMFLCSWSLLKTETTSGFYHAAKQLAEYWTHRQMTCNNCKCIVWYKKEF